ncbi:thioredoxin-dependent thiol peroxidase [Oceanispirochaeta sp.]|jgi:peroxiredoxin Q/BCP|uniref:thioredoxin-dependent thiol peroxidase n=1 Tax=Oceanispirochaeta sp. TaxID=2035350 RepID=UPI0026363CDF|nr:thioredoxin-dependent thiol peroxidase [Oceanispirochaeta sp.]MDA3959039.1 thioredoxin-dependent thiol peroxidase [Oceanispirochaeta sp.]
MLQKGDQVKNFTLQDDHGQEISLSDFRGKKVVVYFYPKDDTPGCTVEACSFRDEHSRFADANTVILGISKDSVEKHEKFKSKYDLPFYLLSDPETTVIKHFGAWGEKKNYGKTYEGIIRSTFILDEVGKVIHTFEKVTTKDHALAVLEEIGKF